ncbi:hypothetical protein Tco_0331332 [Tanacetum coccineum]
MATMAENVIYARSKTLPLMLEKGMYDSWKTQILLYIQGKENGEMLIDLIKNEPVKLLDEITVKDAEGVNEIARKQTPSDLSSQEKLQYDSDIKVVNLLLLGFPVDIYNMINHYQTAKEIWDRINEIIEGTKMTKQASESMLYDEFNKFTSEPEESIYSYYLRYAKLINDMKMILMSMSNMQINTKFVNHLQPEWSRFVTIAKQARDLHSVNFDQRTTLYPHEIGSWEKSDIKELLKKYVIPFSENLKETFKCFEKGFIAEVKEMKDIFEQMEDVVDHCSVSKKCFEIEKKQLLINNDRLLEENIVSDNMCTYLRSLNEVDNCGKCKILDIISENNKLRAQSKGTKLYFVTPLPKSKVIPKVVEKNDLSKSVTSYLNTKKIIEKCTKVLTPSLLKIESELINMYFKNNRVVHRDYLKVTKEHVATLQELLQEARALKPLDEHIGHASKFAERIQEMLVYVSASCLSLKAGMKSGLPLHALKRTISLT